MPLGMGYTVEGQVTGEERHGGLQFVCFDPKPGRFPDQPPRRQTRHPAAAWSAGASRRAPAARPRPPRWASRPAAGCASIYPDPHGIDAWDQANYGRVFVHIVNSQLWREITGEPFPPTPVDARAYTDAGLPWFELYDDQLGDIPASTCGQRQVRGAEDAQHGFTGQQDDTPLQTPNVKPLGNSVPDGKW